MVLLVGGIGRVQPLLVGDVVALRGAVLGRALEALGLGGRGRGRVGRGGRRTRLAQAQQVDVVQTACKQKKGNVSITSSRNKSMREECRLMPVILLAKEKVWENGIGNTINS
jgi:hypothetical protein